jgi:hypothetical protein
VQRSRSSTPAAIARPVFISCTSLKAPERGIALTMSEQLGGDPQHDRGRSLGGSAHEPLAR